MVYDYIYIYTHTASSYSKDTQWSLLYGILMFAELGDDNSTSTSIRVYPVMKILNLSSMSRKIAISGTDLLEFSKFYGFIPGIYLQVLWLKKGTS